ncbi:MAG: adenylate/guanylate cyclase domain-containing protein [Armatimonadetes bacterium]|nr:adenylate/guanylate cyclase domain-containing protein [Armatimonadota bacterium]
MRRKTGSFWEWLREDLKISGFIALGIMTGTLGMYPLPWILRISLALFAAALSALVFSSVLALAQAFVFPRLKFPSFLLSVFATAATYLVIILIAVPSCIVISVCVATGIPPWHSGPWKVAVGFLDPAPVAVAFLMMVVITFVLMVSNKLGPGVLMNWMLGRYYRPREEDRVFLFIDLRDSTPLGEQLGDLRFSRLIQMFFEDISGPIRETKGEVSHYIGDEAVVCWPLARGLKGANCIRCFFLAQEAVERNRAVYLREFGVVPGFKAGAHCGSVVATQVGEIKSEIVFHGDVLNTTARIQGTCNEAGADFLVSETLWRAVGPCPGYAFLDTGVWELKGKGHGANLYAVSKTPGLADGRDP